MFKLDAAVTFKPCKSLSMTEMCTVYLSNLKNSFANKMRAAVERRPVSSDVVVDLFQKQNRKADEPIQWPYCRHTGTFHTCRRAH